MIKNTLRMAKVPNSEVELRKEVIASIRGIAKQNGMDLGKMYCESRQTIKFLAGYSLKFNNCNEDLIQLVKFEVERKYPNLVVTKVVSKFPWGKCIHSFNVTCKLE